MKPTNLNMLFQSQVPDFAHLLTTEPQTREQFAEKVIKSRKDARTILFYDSIHLSEFDTIRLNEEKDAILFNQ